MKIGFIGTGVMGRSMINHLINGGHELYIYTRTKSKAIPLLASGATWCDTPKEVALQTDVIITIVGYPKDVEAIYFGENSISEGLSAGMIVIDMTTSTPDLAIKIAQTFKQLNVGSIDAPVSGGDVGAKNAKLTIMCGGELDVYNKVLPIFKLMGSTIVLQGAPGAGQHTKMCNQIALAGCMLGMVEYIKYAQVNGLDPEKVLKSIGLGSASSTAMDVYAPRIFRDDMEPGFYLKHFVKDLKIAITTMNNQGKTLPGTELVYKLYSELETQGLGEKGTQALIKYFDENK